MMGFGMGMMGGGGFTLIIWIIIIVGIIYLMSNRNTDNNYSNKENKAEEVVRERYARGEINKEEYEELLKDLR